MATVAPCRDAVGFDCNTKLTVQTARALRAMGFQFAIRYTSLTVPKPQDIESNELSIILGEIGALWLIQHPRDPGWHPTEGLGDTDAIAAVRGAQAASYLPGATMWQDLEGIAAGTSPQAVIDYTSKYGMRLAEEGYPHGLYYGFDTMLTADQIYHSLLTVHTYWSDFTSRAVPVRGFALKQVCNSLLLPNVGFEVDIDTCHADKLNERPTWMQAA